MSEREVKIMDGKKGRPKGVKIHTARGIEQPERKGVEIKTGRDKEKPSE